MASEVVKQAAPLTLAMFDGWSKEGKHGNCKPNAEPAMASAQVITAIKPNHHDDPGWHIGTLLRGGRNHD
jgi:hypothetical protein